VNSSVTRRTVWLAAITAATVLVGGGHPTWAQSNSGYNQTRTPRPNKPVRVAQAPASQTSAMPSPTMAPTGPTPAAELPQATGEMDLIPLEDSSTYTSSPMSSSPVDGGDDYWSEGIDGGTMMEGDQADSMLFGLSDCESEVNPEETECSEDAAPVYSSGSWFAPGRMFWYADSIWWGKDDPRPVALARENARQFLTSDARQRFVPGLRTTVGTVLGRDAGGRDHVAEVEFQGLLHWIARLDMRPNALDGLDTQLNNGRPNNANFPGGVQGSAVAGFDDANFASYEYTSDLNTFSINYRIRTRPGRDQMALQPNGEWVRFGDGSQIRSGLAGLKVLFLNETATYASQNAANTTRGNLRVDTDNTLVGPQYGLDLTTKTDDISFGFRGRLGGLINFAAMDVRATTVNPNNTRTLEVSENQLSLLAETGLFASYHLRPNFVLRAGYDVMFLSGLSLAAENLSLTPTFAQQNVSGDVILHGGSIGFESYW
jgi:hypothetical protein